MELNQKFTIFFRLRLLELLFLFFYDSYELKQKSENKKNLPSSRILFAQKQHHTTLHHSQTVTENSL